jgi:hypothetical protein
MTADDPVVPLELREPLAFLLLSVEADPDHAMQPFLQWCTEHRDAIRAAAMTEPTSAHDRA